MHTYMRPSFYLYHIKTKYYRYWAPSHRSRFTIIMQTQKSMTLRMLTSKFKSDYSVDRLIVDVVGMFVITIL